MSRIKIKSPYLLGISFTAVLLAGIIGSVVSATSLTTWYVHLQKPLLIPPGYVFGIAWGILYLLMGVSLYLTWSRDKSKTKTAVKVFFVQLVLNVFWSIFFFGFQSIIGGLVDIFFMIGAIVWTMILFYKHSKIAAYLLIPYLLWVLFATYLNWSVYLLNK